MHLKRGLLQTNKEHKDLTMFSQIWPTSTDGGLELLHYSGEIQRE